MALWGTERSDIFHATCWNRLAGGGRGGGPGPVQPAALLLCGQCWSPPSHLHPRHPGDSGHVPGPQQASGILSCSVGMEASEPSAQLGSFSCSGQTFRAVRVAEMENIWGWVDKGHIGTFV